MEKFLNIVTALGLLAILIGGMFACQQVQTMDPETTISEPEEATKEAPEGAIRLLSGIEYHSNAVDAVEGRNPIVLTEVVYVYIDGYAFVRNGKILESRCTPGEKMDDIPNPPLGVTVVYHVHTVNGKILGWVNKYFFK